MNTNTELSDLLLTHLHEEEETLVSLLNAVREVWHSLVARDGERLTEALRTESAELHRGELMRERRREFRESLAQQLGTTAADITLTRITEFATPDRREELQQSRERLTEMSADLAKLNRQNAAMIRQSLDLTRSIIGQLTGTGPHFAGYNAAGRSDTPHVGPIMQWGG